MNKCVYCGFEGLEDVVNMYLMHVKQTERTDAGQR